MTRPVPGCLSPAGSPLPDITSLADAPHLVHRRRPLNPLRQSPGLSGTEPTSTLPSQEAARCRTRLPHRRPPPASPPGRGHGLVSWRDVAAPIIEQPRPSSAGRASRRLPPPQRLPPLIALEMRRALASSSLFCSQRSVRTGEPRLRRLRPPRRGPHSAHTPTVRVPSSAPVFTRAPGCVGRDEHALLSSPEWASGSQPRGTSRLRTSPVSCHIYVETSLYVGIQRHDQGRGKGTPSRCRLRRVGAQPTQLWSQPGF